mgnify:CR=1 FL=1
MTVAGPEAENTVVAGWRAPAEPRRPRRPANAFD